MYGYAIRSLNHKLIPNSHKTRETLDSFAASGRNITVQQIAVENGKCNDENGKRNVMMMIDRRVREQEHDALCDMVSQFIAILYKSILVGIT